MNAGILEGKALSLSLSVTHAHTHTLTHTHTHTHTHSHTHHSLQLILQFWGGRSLLYYPSKRKEDFSLCPSTAQLIRNHQKCQRETLTFLQWTFLQSSPSQLPPHSSAVLCRSVSGLPCPSNSSAIPK